MSSAHVFIILFFSSGYAWRYSQYKVKEGDPEKQMKAFGEQAYFFTKDFHGTV